MIPQATLRSVKAAVCSIGFITVSKDDYLLDPRAPHYHIVGTGFLVADGIVLTNRHVIRQLYALSARHGRGPEDCYTMFVRMVEGRMEHLLAGIAKHVTVGNPTFDVGLLGLHNADSFNWPELVPLTFCDDYFVEVGQRAACYGYPNGKESLERDLDGGERRVYRVGPILQQGYVSALAPFDESARVDRLLLDMRTSHGMSGAPVFEPVSGRVLGIHDAGIDTTTAFAIPLDAKMVNALLNAFAATGMPAPGEDAMLEAPIPLVVIPNKRSAEGS